MRTKTVFFIIITMIATISASSFVSGKILFKDNFEDDNIGQPPKNWEIGFKGKDDAEVVKDPERSGNKVFSSPTERHDVAGPYISPVKGQTGLTTMFNGKCYSPKNFIWALSFASPGENHSTFSIEDRTQSN